MTVTVQAMEAQLRELDERAAVTTTALREIVERGSSIKTLVQSKTQLRPLVGELERETETLAKRLKDSSEVVQQVVENVRVLDRAQANTRKALERTVDIVGLKTCVEEVTQAMGAERWEQAAASIQRYLNVTPEDSQNEEAALVSLRRSRDTLQGVAVNKCEEAVAAGNQEEVERFCKIMARIEMGEKGVERYAAFLAGRVESAAAAEVSKLRSALALGAPSSSTPFFAQGLTTVLEVVAKAISDGEAVIAEGFGEDARVKLVLAVYDRAAPAIADALELAYAGRNVRALVRKHRDHGEHQQHQPGGAATKEALELDRALQEVSLCLQRLEQFTWFLTARLGAGGALPRVAAIDVKRSELISGYIPLEEAFITYSVEKAPPPPPPPSPVLIGHVSSFSPY